MLFNSIEFLFFFPIAVAIYYVLPHKHRWLWLLVASFYFYMAWEASLIILLLISTGIDYFCGIRIHRENEISKKRRYLYLSLFTNLGILFFFKYLGFFSETTFSILGFFGVDVGAAEPSAGYNMANIIIPVGISFYTFQTMSYSIDVYRGQIAPERNFGRFALYVSFFPQLVAGPIERPNRLLPQFLKKIQIDPQRLKKGLIIMAWGFFLKLVVADRIGVYVDEAFFNTANLKGTPLILASYLFPFQVYYDFSAYTTIAIGAAYAMGFTLVENFNKPIFAFAKGFGVFWRSWHISLMTWFRDYLHRPLVRNFRFSQHHSVLIVFAVCGFWHGANWTFFIWGILNGIFLVTEVYIKRRRSKAGKKPFLASKPILNSIFTWSLCFTLVSFSLIFFRASSVEHALLYIKNLTKVHSFHINLINDKIEIILIGLLIILVQVIHYFKGNNKVFELVLNRPRSIRWLIYICFIIVIVFFAINRKEPFIYHQF